jgi:hypothetical protein
LFRVFAPVIVWVEFRKKTLLLVFVLSISSFMSFISSLVTYIEIVSHTAKVYCVFQRTFGLLVSFNTTCQAHLTTVRVSPLLAVHFTISLLITGFGILVLVLSMFSKTKKKFQVAGYKAPSPVFTIMVVSLAPIQA